MNTLLPELWQTRATAHAKAKSDKGFTLIELLVVVVILGVLIAIAIPLYLNYRKGANDASAQSDMRNAINVLEQCNTDNAKYPTGAVAQTDGIVVTVAPGASCPNQTINLSAGTKFQYKPDSTAGASYIIAATNANGSGKFYCYNSAKGGQVAAVATAIATSALVTC